MTSETSDDIQLNTRLDIVEGQLSEPGVQAISVGFVRLESFNGELAEEYDVFIKASNYSPDDDGAREVATQLIMAGESILQKLNPEMTEDERIIQELIKGGMEPNVARTTGVKLVKQLNESPLNRTMHPQDPERWAGINSQAELDEQRQAWGVEPERPLRHDIRSFETPQHVLDARAARKASRDGRERDQKAHKDRAKGFNPKPAKGGS